MLVGNSSPLPATPCTCSLRRGVCLWRTPKQVGWGLQEKRGACLRVPKALGRINGDRSGCRQERGAVIWILVEAGEMLLGSLRQAVKYGGAGHGLMESCGDSKVAGGDLLISMARGCWWSLRQEEMCRQRGLGGQGGCSW